MSTALKNNPRSVLIYLDLSDHSFDDKCEWLVGSYFWLSSFLTFQLLSHWVMLWRVSHMVFNNLCWQTARYLAKVGAHFSNIVPWARGQYLHVHNVLYVTAFISCECDYCLYTLIGASVLAQSLKQNKHMEFSLVHFDLSGNPIGPDPLAALTFIQEPQTISYLNLSGCGLTLEPVVQVRWLAVMRFVI